MCRDLVVLLLISPIFPSFSPLASAYDPPLPLTSTDQSPNRKNVGGLCRADRGPKENSKSPIELRTALADSPRTYKVGLEENDLQWLLAKGVLGLDLKHKEHVYRTRKPRAASSPVLDARSRLILKNTGQLLAEQGVAHSMSNSTLESHRNKENEIPIWNKRDRELQWRGKLVKRFTTPAINQELLLDEFEKRGWVRRIENPLSDAINDLSKEQLAQAVRRLNGCQREPRIRFTRDGTGHGVRWEG
jgi:hypothetical protein